MKIGMEKIDTHEGVMVKALLDSGATGMFVDKMFAEKHGFKLDKLEKLLTVTNTDGSNNSGGRIIHKIECNIYYRGHQERMKFNMCNLGRTDVILGMPWLAAHNPEIDWEKGEAKMTKCPPWCGKDNRSKEAREKQERVTRREARTAEGEKAISWAADKEGLGKGGRNGDQLLKNQNYGAQVVPLVVESVWESGVGKDAS